MCLPTKLGLIIVMTIPLALADSLNVVNANFQNVSVQCGQGYAYQSYMSGNCGAPGGPQQQFNSSVGIGWAFVSGPHSSTGPGNSDGLTDPNTAFNPPSFTGLPFNRAAFLQGANTAFGQAISGFVPNGAYTLSFYLGSRFQDYIGPDSSFDGNQTVEALIDGKVIGTWNLVTFTPFTLETINFTVPTGGSHILTFEGTATGDHTAFLSGVSIQTASNLSVNPTTTLPGFAITASAVGLTPGEKVYLAGYESATPAFIGAGNADSTGAANVIGVIPQTPFGSYGVQLIGASSKNVFSGIVRIIRRAVVTPTTTSIGSQIKVEGFGFAADEPIYIVLSTQSTLLGSTVTQSNGSFPAVSVTIPTTATPGADTMYVIGQRSGAVESVQITVQ